MLKMYGQNKHKVKAAALNMTIIKDHLKLFYLMSEFIINSLISLQI